MLTYWGRKHRCCDNISRFRHADSTLPPYVSLEYSQGVTSYENPQYAGAAHSPLHIAGGDGVRNLGLLNGISRTRFDDRRGLLNSGSPPFLLGGDYRLWYE